MSEFRSKSGVCGKSEGKHFKTKCTPAGTLLKYLVMKYWKFKLQLKFRYDYINSLILKIFKVFNIKKVLIQN
jgi:hypothetical protein